jgi:hypothetical protein
LPLGFANDDGVSVHRGFLRAQRGMKSTEHDLDASLPVFGCDLISAPRRVGLDTDRNKVGRLIKGDDFQPVVVKTHVDVIGCQACN